MHGTLDLVVEYGYLDSMKVTKYFKHVRSRTDRAQIRDEWIEEAVQNPEFRHIQVDGRIRLWKRIQAADGKWLRVILLEDGETIHNAFFDRRFKGEEE
jgi:hypothetical protein